MKKALVYPSLTKLAVHRIISLHNLLSIFHLKTDQDPKFTQTEKVTLFNKLFGNEFNLHDFRDAVRNKLLSIQFLNDKANILLTFPDAQCLPPTLLYFLWTELVILHYETDFCKFLEQRKSRYTPGFAKKYKGSCIYTYAIKKHMAYWGEDTHPSEQQDAAL